MVNKKLKICFVSPFAYGLFEPRVDLKFGGAEVQMYLVSKELALDEDFDVNVLVLDLGQEKVRIYDGVKVHKAHQRGRGVFNLLVAPVKIFLTLAKIKPDVVVCRAFGVELGISAIYAKIFRKKLVYSIAHDQDITGEFFRGLRGLIFKLGFWLTDIYVAQYQGQIDALVKKYPKRKNDIVVIKNSIKLKKEVNVLRESILWVGSSAPMKRANIFLDLARDFPEQKFVMIMTKSSQAEKSWDEIALKQQSIANLQIIAKVDFGEINRYYDQAKVFVSTASAEGFPNTFLQAANSRVPILSLKVDPDNFIVKNQCGFVCNDEYGDLKDKLSLLLDDNNLRQEMGENGYKYLAQEHKIEINIENWKTLLNN